MLPSLCASCQDGLLIGADAAGRCADCRRFMGSTIDGGETYDFSSAREELRQVHALLREKGLEQAEDGEWGQTVGYYEPEWDEAGSTVNALTKVLGDHSYAHGYYTAFGEGEKLRAAIVRYLRADGSEGGFDGRELYRARLDIFAALGRPLTDDLRAYQAALDEEAKD